jgi:hypothetical protein
LLETIWEQMMNERIRELADKIWEEKYWTNPNTDKLLPAQLNRFAELIVRECIQNIRDNMEIAKVDTLGDKDLFLETLRTSGHFYITELERHFGVEE